MVFFTGENAQGKTSLLEAVAVAARLGSPRATRQAQLVKEGRKGCGVAIQTDTHFHKAIYEERKFSLTMDGQSCLRREYLAVSPRIIWMENRDLEIIRGSGEKRRRYLDALGSQSHEEYAESLKMYSKALRSRNALLKDGRVGEGSFTSFSEQLVKHGQILIEHRERLLQELIPPITESQAQISGKRETFSMEYNPSARDLERELAEGLQKDVILKQTQIGPHRDDFSLSVDGRAASDFASEGQQRTLALALRLAQGELIRKNAGQAETMYLIDDVFGELDEARRHALLSALPAECQRILTTTNLNWGKIDAAVYKVEAGTCRLG